MRQFKSLIAFFVLIIFIGGCQKNSVQPKSDSSINSDEVSLMRDGLAYTLTLRPGQNKGQDVYVCKEKGVKSDNVNYVPELSIVAWTIDGNPYNSSAYIRFDDLNQVPQSANIVSAELHLYSLPSSISTPQGNYGDNACFIRRVIEPWDQSEINFSNKPAATDSDKVIMPASTSQWGYNPVVDVTKLVSYMVTHPDENFGFNIKLKKQEIYRSLVFGSSEQSDRNYRPKLVIRYK